MDAASSDETSESYVLDPEVRHLSDLVKRAQDLTATLCGPVGEQVTTAVPQVPQEAVWEYNVWYTDALECVARLAPQRRAEFERLYEPETEQLTLLRYGTANFLAGVTVTGSDGRVAFDHVTAFRSAFGRQQAILMGAMVGVYSPVGRQASHDELEEAERLLSLGSMRAAGCLAGVALERHVRTLGATQPTPITAEKVARVNDALKAAGALDQIQWRLIQGLLDVRNACAHPDQQPGDEDVRRLVTETRKMVDAGS